MPETDSKGFNIPWAPLLALVATIAGLATLLPARSARPPAGGMDFAGSKSVSARLWQDPLQVVSEAEARLHKDTQQGKPIGWDDLRKEYKKLAEANGGSPLVMMVCVPHSPYAEEVERRVRDRVAVLQALAAEGYFPRHSTSLKYVSVKRPSEKTDQPAAGGNWGQPRDNGQQRTNALGLEGNPRTCNWRKRRRRRTGRIAVRVVRTSACGRQTAALECPRFVGW